jgi:hypothetical protein
VRGLAVDPGSSAQQFEVRKYYSEGKLLDCEPYAVWVIRDSYLICPRCRKTGLVVATDSLPAWVLEMHAEEFADGGEACVCPCNGGFIE